MPLTVRKFKAKVRDSQTGNMIPAGLLSSDALEAIEDAKDSALDEIDDQVDIATDAAAAAQESAQSAASAALTGNLAPQYSGTATYEIGDHVLQNGTLYRCNTTISSPQSTFVAAHWTQVMVGPQVDDIIKINQPADDGTKIRVVTSDEDVDLVTVEDLEGYVPAPQESGEGGQILATDGEDGTYWTSVGTPDYETTQRAVNTWMESHSGQYIIPDGNVTTAKIADEAVTESKLDDDLKLKVIKDYVTPEMYGAKGDGETNDTSALQSMFNYAAEHGIGVFSAKDVNYLSDAITIPTGIPFVYLAGTIIDTGATKNALITLGTANNPVVKSIITLNVKVGANTSYGIYGENVTDTTITECKIESVAEGVRKYLILLKTSNNNVISNCKIINNLEPSNQWQFGIVLMSDLTAAYGGYFDNGGGGIVMADNPCSNNTIINNEILNGTHGVVINGGIKNKVLDNYIAYPSHRCVALEPSACDNLIANNHFHAYGSAGVIMGYNAYRNMVCDNKFSDDLSVFSPDGEGAITMYVGVHENKITGNYIDSHRRWGIYMAIDAIDNIVSDNVIKNYRLAGIALESDWIPNGGTIQEATMPSNAKYSRSFYPSTMYNTDGNIVAYWAYNNSSGNRITKNEIYNADTDAKTHIYLSQLGNRIKNTLNVIDGNICSSIATSADFYLYVYEDTSYYLINNSLQNNIFINSKNKPNAFNFTVADMFAFRGNNGYIDDGIIEVNGSTINAIKGKYFKCNNSNAVSVSSISNIISSHDYYIILDNNTSIIESSRIKLKNGTITPGDNKVIHFVSLDGVILREV